MYLGPWFIYVMFDPRDPDTIRYVGWTKDPEVRLKSHITRARDGQDRTYCGNWKRSVLKDGVVPTLIIIESGYGDGWDSAERKWIAHYKSRVGTKLTNLTEGGGGVVGHHWTLSEETKRKISVASKGRKQTPEAIQRMADSKKGKPRLPEHIESAAAPRRGKRRTPEAIANSALGHVGLTHTDEAKKKIREYHSKLERRTKLEPKRSEASRLKTSESLKKHYASVGSLRIRTEESRLKTSSSMKKYHKRLALAQHLG
jgi:hypothetical protein